MQLMLYSIFVYLNFDCDSLVASFGTQKSTGFRMFQFGFVFQMTSLNYLKQLECGDNEGETKIVMIGMSSGRQVKVKKAAVI